MLNFTSQHKPESIIKRAFIDAVARSTWRS